MNEKSLVMPRALDHSGPSNYRSNVRFGITFIQRAVDV